MRRWCQERLWRAWSRAAGQAWWFSWRSPLLLALRARPQPLFLPVRSGLHDGERVARTILGDVPCPREREMVAADHQLVGNHTVEQLAARFLGKLGILVVLPVPAGIGDHQRRHIGGVVRDHQLARSRREMERAMAGGVAGRADEANAGSHFGLPF